MTRNKGSKNTNPSFVSNDRIKKKAVKLKAAVNEFLDLAGRNRFANPQMDYVKWNEIEQTLQFIIVTDPE